MNAIKVTYTIVIRVEKRDGINLINHGLFPPSMLMRIYHISRNKINHRCVDIRSRSGLVIVHKNRFSGSLSKSEFDASSVQWN